MADFPGLTSLLGVFGAFYGIVMMFSSAIGIVMYILQALGIFNMSKKLGINNAWLCFVPVVNTYAFGKVAEKYVKQDGKPSAKFGIWLLVLNILLVIALFVLLAVLVVFVIGIAGIEDVMLEDSAAVRAEILSFIIPFIAVYFVTLALAIVLSVMQYVALWRIFAIFSYNNATLFLILSILFGILTPIFLFIIRNNPPRINLTQQYETPEELPIF